MADCGHVMLSRFRFYNCRFFVFERMQTRISTLYFLHLVFVRTQTGQRDNHENTTTHFNHANERSQNVGLARGRVVFSRFC